MKYNKSSISRQVMQKIKPAVRKTSIASKIIIFAVLCAGLLNIYGFFSANTVEAAVGASKSSPRCFQQAPSVPTRFRGFWEVKCPENRPDSNSPNYFQPGNCYVSFAETAVWEDFVKYPCRHINKKTTKNPAKSPGAPVPVAPPISRCNQKTDPKNCKKEYRNCNRLQGPRISETVVKCKKNVIAKYKDKKKSGTATTAAPKPEDKYKGTYLCGNIRTENKGRSGPLSDDNYRTKINFGCLGTAGPAGLNPILDVVYALLRFISVGVGIAVVIAVVGSAIQYAASEGNPEVTAKAKNRIRSTIIGLFVYIFAFSLFQFLVPGGLFKPGIWLILFNYPGPFL